MKQRDELAGSTADAAAIPESKTIRTSTKATPFFSIVENHNTMTANKEEKKAREIQQSLINHSWKRETHSWRMDWFAFEAIDWWFDGEKTSMKTLITLLSGE